MKKEITDLEGLIMKKISTYEDVHALLHSRPASAALEAAIETGLLWMLAKKPMTGEEVVKALNLPGKRGYYWLQYLNSLGILKEGPRGYLPSPVTQSAILESRSRENWQHLVQDQQEKDACAFGLSQLISEAGSLWGLQGLSEPIHYVEKMKADPQRAREFTRLLFELHQELAKKVAEILDLSGIEHMMDIGGGSGVVSMALLRKYPALDSTVVDIENVCIAGREIALEQGLSDRLLYHPADFLKDKFPTGFDLVLKCDVAFYDPVFLRKLWHSLKPGGKLIFVDHLSPAQNLAPNTRLEWTFLDSLRDPDFSFPTPDELSLRLVEAGFTALDEPLRSINGLYVFRAEKEA